MRAATGRVPDVWLRRPILNKSQNKTMPGDAPVEQFLDSIEDERRRADAIELCSLLREATGSEPTMWGGSIVGFGNHHYVYDSGREGDTAAVGFSPRKTALTIYGLKFYDQGAEAVEQLGSVTTGKGCVYVKDLSAIDKILLSRLAAEAFHERDNS
jgi:hypothetical protein